MRTLRGTSGMALVLTYGLIVLGAWVRATGSGLSCPDWPTCYGHWVPLPGDIPADVGYSYLQVMLEWVHRLIAGVILGPLVLLIGVSAWRARGMQPRMPAYAGALILLLLVQAGLGGLTVLDQNSPWSVALHLGTALVLLSVLCLIFERAGQASHHVAAARQRTLCGVTWLLALGAMVSAAHGRQDRRRARLRPLLAAVRRRAAAGPRRPPDPPAFHASPAGGRRRARGARWRSPRAAMLASARSHRSPRRWSRSRSDWVPRSAAGEVPFGTAPRPSGAGRPGVRHPFGNPMWRAHGRTPGREIAHGAYRTLEERFKRLSDIGGAPRCWNGTIRPRATRRQRDPRRAGRDVAPDAHEPLTAPTARLICWVRPRRRHRSSMPGSAPTCARCGAVTRGR